MNNYSIEDGYGNCLTEGMQNRNNAIRIAKQFANEKGKSVWLCEGEGEGNVDSDTETGLEIEPNCTE